MKYWLFQNNQVIGPYAPEDLSRLVSFTPESLVCPEGRKGTSMTDWQRAGMVPDLSVALVKANSRQPAGRGLATIAGLPPEPTLKDLAMLGSLQEKVGMLEDIAAQLQESLRQKEAELSAVHGELSDKGREAKELRDEAQAQKRQADELRRQLSGLEERLSGVNALSDNLDKAVEAEKQVQGDILKQGETIAALARELEELRRRLEERPVAPPPAAASAPFADAGLPSGPAPEPTALAPLPDIAEPPAPVPLPDIAEPPAPVPLPDIAEPTAAHVPPPPASVAAPDFSLDMPPVAPAPEGAISLDPALAPEPGATAPAGAAASLEPVMPAASFQAPIDPLARPAAAPAVDAFQPSGDLMADVHRPSPKRGKALLVGALLGVLVIGAGAFHMGLIPGLGVAPKNEPVAAAPLPAPEAVPAPPPAADPRQEAIALAKGWSLPGGQTLGSKLETVAPASGSFLPWMAEANSDGRVFVNYFASGAAAGSPTIAYEFVVDLAAKSLSGRNAAAKAILNGKAPVPPKPLAPKPVKLKPKKAAAPVEDEGSLDSLLGGDEKPSKAAPAAKSAPTLEAKPVAPPEPKPAPEATPAAKARSRPARGGKKGAKDGKAPDEALLDDLLQE